MCSVAYILFYSCPNEVKLVTRVSRHINLRNIRILALNSFPTGLTNYSKFGLKQSFKSKRGRIVKLSPFAYFAYHLGLNGYYSMWNFYIDVL